MQNRSIDPRMLAALSALAFVSVPVFAQQANSKPESTTATTTKVADGDEEAIELSPFKVSTDKDTGYKVTNATSGTRLDTAIKDTPLNLEVVTNDFMRDTGATNLREALRYSAGVVLESQSDAFAETDGDAQRAGANDPRGATRRVGDSSSKLRGFMIDQVLRDGFRRQYSADWINIARVEVLRGPSALLYGVGSFGGVINYIAKKPERKSSNYVGASIGSYGFTRAEFDSTGALGKDHPWKPAYRVTGALEKSGDYTQYYKQKHFFVSPSFTFTPTKTTTVVIDNEFGYKDEHGVGFQNIRSGWSSAGRDAAFLTNNSTLVDARTFRWSGPDTYLKGPFRNHIIDIEQKLGEDVVVKVGVAQSESNFNSRQVASASPWVPTGNFNVNNPNMYYSGTATSKITIDSWTGEFKTALASAQSNGTFQGKTAAEILALAPAKSYRGDSLLAWVTSHNLGKDAANKVPETQLATIRYYWDDYNKDELRNQLRAEAVYNKSLGKWGKHTLLTGVQYMKLNSQEDEYRPWGSSDADQGTRPNTENIYSFHNPSDFTAIRYGTQGDGLADNPQVHTNHIENLTWDTGYYAVYQGKFLKDRVTLIGGLRWDRSDARTTTSFTYGPTRADEVQARGVMGNPAFISKLALMGIDLPSNNKAPSASSPQVGINIEVTKNISLFGLYSTGVVPNPFAYDGYGQSLKPTKAKNYEAGIKFDLWDGRISGTVSAYRIEREGQPKYIWWAPSPYNALKNGYDPTKPASTVAWFTTPEAMWYGLHETQGKSVTQALATAKTIWGKYWWPLLEELATTSDVSKAQSGTNGSKFWTWNDSGYAYHANGNTGNGYTGSDGAYFPLVNFSNSDNAAFFAAALGHTGWAGNYYANAGITYNYGDGSTGTGNSPVSNGAYVPMNDQANGWDASFVISPIQNLQVMLNFAHVDRKVTSRTFAFVKSGFFPGAWYFASDNNYGTYDNTITYKDVYGNANDTSTYNQTVPDYNSSEDDSPRNTASIWARYSFDKGWESLKGWEIGLGGSWEDNRMWYSGFSGGNISLIDGTRTLLKYWTQERYTVNGMLAYNTKIGRNHNIRYSLNVNNILDDKDMYGLLYAPGISYRFSVGLNF